MPCRSCPDEYRGSERVRTEIQYVERDNPRLVKRLDDVTALLCDTMNELRVIAPKTYRRLLKRSSNLRAWWLQHQIEDEKRTGKRFSRIKLKSNGDSTSTTNRRKD